LSTTEQQNQSSTKPVKNVIDDSEPRLLRGGSWGGDPRYCRSAYRIHLLPDFADDVVGFRVACLPQGPSLNPLIPQSLNPSTFGCFINLAVGLRLLVIGCSGMGH
jgi:hypothetical protein